MWGWGMALTERAGTPGCIATCAAKPSASLPGGTSGSFKTRTPQAAPPFLRVRRPPETSHCDQRAIREARPALSTQPERPRMLPNILGRSSSIR